jgi:hypothetical protein
MSQRTLEQIYGDLSELSVTLKDQILDNLVCEIKNLISDEEEKKAVKGWKKGSGKIRLSSEKTLAIEVYRNENYPGIMINRSYNTHGQLMSGWTISHDLSGLRLGDKRYSNMRKAVKAFLEHAANVNWNRPEKEIVADPEARTAHYNLKAN